MKRFVVAVLFVLAACGESNENLSVSKPSEPAISRIQPESSSSPGQGKVGSPSAKEGLVVGEGAPDEPCPQTNHQGPIVFFDNVKGFGFIGRDREDTGKIIFHISDVVGDYQDLKRGDCVQYLDETDRQTGKLLAVAVTRVSP